MHKQTTLLIVDDLEPNRQLIKAHLGNNGYDFLMAEGGQQAIKLLESGVDVDLILLDIMMPDINGIEVLKRIKANDELCDIPVVMITAMDEDASLPTCLKLGASDYVSKSSKAPILKARVTAQLSRKRVLDAAHISGRELTHKIEQRTRALQQARRMESIGTLVGGIAHEFNNMLAGITSNVFMLKLRTRNIPDVTQQLDHIESISFRAADMIEQLLTFARKDVASMQPLAFNAFITATLQSLRLSLHEDIRMHEEICMQPLQVNGDGAKLHQVLLNLIHNARDALEGMPDPCITVRLESWLADTAFIEKHPYVKGGTYAHLSVTDNGCGIPAQQKEQLFEPFFTTREVGKGIGLGLSMVFGAVKTHHGFVEVDSIEGKGSTFHLYLPLLHAEDKPAASTPQNIVKGYGETILLVDDEQQITETGKEVLESLGYQVLIATNGQQAVEIFQARSGEIDLCILDIDMSGISGTEAAQCMRRINPHVKVIFSTGYDKNILTGMKHEIVLNKPFPIEKMSRLIRRQLS